MHTTNNNIQRINALDFIRLLAAVGICTSHAFLENTTFFDNYFVPILTRWCVGFFFIVSGFFLKETYPGMVRYCLSILKIYICWTIIYALIYHINIWNPYDFLSGLRSGIIMPFWYFPTLLMCYVFVWVLNHFIKNPFIVCLITGSMFIFALMGSTWQNIPCMSAFMDKYFFVWHERIMGIRNTRNGLFNGSFYLSLGFLINKLNIKEKISIKNNRKFYALSLLLVLCYIVEICAVVHFKLGQLDVLLFGPAIASLLLIVGINTTMEYSLAIALRKMSLYIFLIHCFFLNLFQQYIHNQWIVYFLELIASFAFAYIYAIILSPYKDKLVDKLKSKVKINKTN